MVLFLDYECDIEFRLQKYIALWNTLILTCFCHVFFSVKTNSF